MNLIIRVIILLAWFISFSVFAESSAVEKYRNYTPNEIADLPKNVRAESVPIMYLMAARSGLSKGSELVFAMELNTLMYPGVEDYKNAVRSFQKDLGDKPTGVLTVWQIYKLGQRSDFQKLSTISFPSDYSSSKSSDYADIRGTMMIQGDRIAWPINHVEIQCYRSEKYCEITELYMVLPDEKEWGATFSVVQDIPQFYKITRWSNDIINAQPSSPGKHCRTTTLNLNFKTKEFYQITTNGSGSCNTMGISFPRLKNPRISKVVHGKKIFDKEFSALRRTAFSFLSSEFKGKIKRFRAISK